MSKKKTTLYIAGPMRGYDEFNFPAFFDAEATLKGFGYNTINPARHDTDNGFKWENTTGSEPSEELGLDVVKALDWDLRQIAGEADGVAVLGSQIDWRFSRGTSIEIALASVLDKPVAYVNSWRYMDFAKNRSPFAQVWVSGIRDANVLHRAKLWLKHYREGLDTKQVLEETYAPTEQSENETLSTKNTEYLASYPQVISPYLQGETQETRTVSASGGEKGVKPARYDLIPVDALKQVAEHYTVGAKKYSDHNWRKGYEWSKSYAALQRHANQFWGGEDIDEETGSKHLAAVVFHALALMTFMDEHPEYDDRYKSDRGTK